MPIYEYEASDSRHSCAHCRHGFEHLARSSDAVLTRCPECSGPVQKIISAHSVGSSKSGFDSRAKNAGFQKLERLGHGEYEKKY